MSNIVYTGYGAEIEDDVVRFRRRTLESGYDVAHHSDRSEWRPRRRLNLRRPITIKSAISRSR